MSVQAVAGSQGLIDSDAHGDPHCESFIDFGSDTFGDCTDCGESQISCSMGCAGTGFMLQPVLEQKRSDAMHAWHVEEYLLRDAERPDPLLDPPKVTFFS